MKKAKEEEVCKMGSGMQSKIYNNALHLNRFLDFRCFHICHFISIPSTPESHKYAPHLFMGHFWVVHGWKQRAKVRNSATYSKQSLNLCQQPREIQRYIKGNSCLGGDLSYHYQWPSLISASPFTLVSLLRSSQLPNNHCSHGADEVYPDLIRERTKLDIIEPMYCLS